MNNSIVKLLILLIFNSLTGFYGVAVAAVLDVGAGITCGIQVDDTIACGGWAYSKKPASDLKQLENIQGNTFSQLSVGYGGGCGIRSNDNTLGCFLGTQYGMNKVPSGTFSQVSIGTFHACGVRTDGSVVCWGGKTDTIDYGQTKAPTTGTFSQVSVGRWHSCALKTDQTVECWGNNRYGQTQPPKDTFSQISAAKIGWHTCGIKTDDQTVVCWGLNDHDQSIPPKGRFAQISAGKWYTCGIRADDQTIACWGSNMDGQADPPSGRFSYVSAGMYHTCAIQFEDHAPICWGYDLWGSVKNISKDSLPLKISD